MNKKEKEDVPKLVLYAVALGMGIASAVLSILGQSHTIGLFAGIGIACLAVAGLDAVEGV